MDLGNFADARRALMSDPGGHGGWARACGVAVGGRMMAGSGPMVTFRVVVYADVGATRCAEWISTAQFMEEESVRSFATMQLLDVYRRPDRVKDDLHHYWCEVSRGRYADAGELKKHGGFDFDAQWVADHGGAYVDAAYLDNESGEVSWDAGVRRASWPFPRPALVAPP